MTTVNIDLGVNGAGDAAADAVIVNGTAAADVIQAIAVGDAVQVTGLAAQVNITQSGGGQRPPRRSTAWAATTRSPAASAWRR